MSSVLWSNDNEHVKHIWNVTWCNVRSLSLALLNQCISISKSIFRNWSKCARRHSLIFNKLRNELKNIWKAFLHVIRSLALHFVASYSPSLTIKYWLIVIDSNANYNDRLWSCMINARFDKSGKKLFIDRRSDWSSDREENFKRKRNLLFNVDDRNEFRREIFRLFNHAGF